jgi:nuclear pore complex protein Nup133
VYLCHHPKAGSAGPANIQRYIEKFGAEFAFVLYQWYIDEGQVAALLSQDEMYGGLLTSFFEANPYPGLAWVHHVACKRYGMAGEALKAVDGVTRVVGKKDVSHVAE